MYANRGPFLKERFREIKAVFLSVYFAAGILAGFYFLAFISLGISPFRSLNDGLMYVVFGYPILIAVTGWVLFFKHANTNPFLFVSSVLWLIITSGEILEGWPYTPNVIVIVLMLLVSCVCLAFLAFGLISKPKV